MAKEDRLMFSNWKLAIAILAVAGVLLWTPQAEARPVVVYGGYGVGVHVGAYRPAYYYPAYTHVGVYRPYYAAYRPYTYYGGGLYPSWYYGGLYSVPAYSYNYSVNVTPIVRAPIVPSPANYQSFYQPPTYIPPPPPVSSAREPNTVLVNVRVPDATTQVFIDGQKTTRQGIDRQFVSPPLPEGKKFSYEIEAKWMQDGKEVSQMRKVVIQAGETVNVDFTRPAQP